MTTSRTASGSYKTIQEFQLHRYLKSQPRSVTTRVQPPWEELDGDICAAVATITNPRWPKPKITIKVFRKSTDAFVDEELDLVHLHDYQYAVKAGHPLPLQARASELSCQLRWRLPKKSSADPTLYQRGQLVFKFADATRAFVAAIELLVFVMRVDEPVTPNEASTASTSAPATSTPASGPAPGRSASTSAAIPPSMHRVQTAFQPSRVQNAVPSSSSLFGPSASRPVSRKESSKRKKLANVDEDSEMVDAERPSTETQGSVPKKKQRSNPSPDKITGPAKSVARPSSSSQIRPAVQSTNRTASVAPAARASTDRKSSTSLSSSPGSSGSPTPAQIKKAARPPNPFIKANARAPSTTTGPAGPELMPRTPISTQPDRPQPAQTSTAAASDLLTLQHAMPHKHLPPSSYGMRPMAAEHAPFPVFTPASVPVAVAQSVFEDFASLSFVPPVVLTEKAAAPSTIPSFPMDTSFLMDAPISPYVSPPASSRSVSSAAAAAAAPAIGMLVTIEEVTENSDTGGSATASGRGVDPRERGGDGVRVEEMTNEDEMELDELNDDALREVVDQVMLEAGFSDLVKRIERMMPISEE